MIRSVLQGVILLLLVLHVWAADDDDDSADEDRRRTQLRGLVAVTATQVAQYEHRGCLALTAPAALLTGPAPAARYIWDREASPALCAEVCGQRGAPAMLLTGGDECRCLATPVPDDLRQLSVGADGPMLAPDRCRVGCSGARALYCGGPGAGDWYAVSWRSPVVPPSSQFLLHLPSPPPWGFNLVYFWLSYPPPPQVRFVQCPVATATATRAQPGFLARPGHGDLQRRRRVARHVGRGQTVGGCIFHRGHGVD